VIVEHSRPLREGERADCSGGREQHGEGDT
jgi:hypothetical protein